MSGLAIACGIVIGFVGPGIWLGWTAAVAVTVYNFLMKKM